MGRKEEEAWSRPRVWEEDRAEDSVLVCDIPGWEEVTSETTGPGEGGVGGLLTRWQRAEAGAHTGRLPRSPGRCGSTEGTSRNVGEWGACEGRGLEDLRMQGVWR